MWVVALMSALLVGTIFSFEPDTSQTDTDAEPDVTDDLTPDPVTPTLGDTPDVEEETPDPTPDPEEEVGTLLSYIGQESILGTAGDDTLLGDPSDDVVEVPGTTTIELGAGNDFAQVSLEEITANGGAGDDTIEGLVTNATIMGGDGNDSITGAGNNLLQGEAGDDTITVNITSPHDGTANVFGGEGDDLIRVTSAIGADNTAAGNADVRGDAGADTFDLEFELTDTAPVVDGPTTIESNPNVRILDFDAASDVIQIEIMRADGTEPRPITSTALTRVEDDGDLGPYTDVLLTFAGSETVTEVTSTFRVFSAVPFSVDDLQIVVATAA